MLNTHRILVRLLPLMQGGLFALFIAVQQVQLHKETALRRIPPALAASQLQLLSFGERPLMARSLGIWLQTFDTQSGRLIPFTAFNYDYLIAWFEAIASLDPKSQYPLLTASRIFIESKNPQQVREIIAYVSRQFRQAPEWRWRWQLEMIIVAKHRLRDLPLARALARDLNDYTQDVSIPDWMRNMEHLILAEMGEIEAAIRVIDALLTSGIIQDANEIRFLTNKLKQLIESTELP